jgi:hypothetical protein
MFIQAMLVPTGGTGLMHGIIGTALITVITVGLITDTILIGILLTVGILLIIMVDIMDSVITGLHGIIIDLTTTVTEIITIIMVMDIIVTMEAEMLPIMPVGVAL